jgi:hypothetical protein
MGHNGFAANGQQCLNCLSQQTGQPHNAILQAADMLAFGVCEFHAKGYSEFAARIASQTGRKRIWELRLDTSSIEAVKEDINRNLYLKRSGFPGAKKLSELTMW